MGCGGGGADSVGPGIELHWLNPLNGDLDDEDFDADDDDPDDEDDEDDDEPAS